MFEARFDTSEPKYQGVLLCPVCGREITDMDDDGIRLVTRWSRTMRDDEVIGCTGCLEFWGSESWKEAHTA